MTYSKELHESLRLRTLINDIVNIRDEDLFDLLSEIDRLNTETAANKWVSVKVALPNDPQYPVMHPVIGYYGDGAISQIDFVHWSGGETSWEKDGVMLYDVTHWRELPTPPTGGECD